MGQNQDQKLLVLVRTITDLAMKAHPRVLRNQRDEVESSALLAVAQAVQVCECLRNDRPTYSPIAVRFAYSRLMRELIRSGLMPVRLKDGFASTNWIGEVSGDTMDCPDKGVELFEILNNAVNRLGAEDQLLFYELMVEGTPPESVASDMGITVATVNRRSCFIRQVLSKALLDS